MLENLADEVKKARPIEDKLQAFTEAKYYNFLKDKEEKEDVVFSPQENTENDNGSGRTENQIRADVKSG